MHDPIRTASTDYYTLRTVYSEQPAFVINADGSRVVGLTAALMRLCLFYMRYLKTDAAGVTKRDTEMSHHESWKPI